MSVTKEDVKKFLDLMNRLKETVEEETDRRVKCQICQESDFEEYGGYYTCEHCGCQNGHVLGYYDKRDEEHMVFRKKSIYKRRYHYIKRVDEVSKKIQLNEEEKDDLFNELMEINDEIMERINKKMKRKRMINIVFLMKKILEEKGNEKHLLLELNTSTKTFAYYEKWWKEYKSIKHPEVDK